MASVTETLESMATLVQDLSGQLAAIATATRAAVREAAREVAGTVGEIAGLSHQSSGMASRGAECRPPRPGGDRETDCQPSATSELDA